MANRMQAIAAYCPRVKLIKRANFKEVVQMIAHRCTLGEGEVLNALKELRDTVTYLCKIGRSASIEGLGTYAPTISLDGSFGVSHKLHPDIKYELNKPFVFTGDIDNRDMIGKTVDELIARWNLEHPEDPIT